MDAQKVANKKAVRMTPFASAHAILLIVY